MSAQMADMTKAHEHGDMTISMLKGAAGFQRKEVQRMLSWVRKELPRLDLVVISNLMLAGVGVEVKRALGLPLIASMQGEDSYLDGLPSEQKDEAWQLLREACREIDVLIGVSAFFARYMGERLQLADEQLRVIDNGVDLDGYAVADRRPAPPELGFFAHITPSKGLHTVVDAFIAIAAEPAFADWRLAIGGSCTKADERYLNEQRAKLARAGLSDRVRYATNLTKEEKQEFYRSVSVLSVVPTYPEAFGLYVIETLASGTPLIAPQRGALPELIEQLGGGVAFPVTEPQADAAALADALRQAVGSTEDLAGLQAQAVAARAQVQERFTDAAMAEAFAQLLEEVVARDGRPQGQQS